MNAATLNTFCAVQELDYVEQGISDGIRGAWFLTRKRERKFFTDEQVQAFTDKVKSDSNRHARIDSFTS